MKKRSGQITFFFIIGLIILLVVGLYIYTSAGINEKEALKKISDQASNTEMTNTLYGCMDEAIAETLKDAVFKGGAVEPQIDEFSDVNIGDYNGRNPVDSDSGIAYGIMVKNERSPHTILSPTDNPVPQRDSIALMNSEIDPDGSKYWAGYFGDITLPKLCDKDPSMPNGIGSKGVQCRIDTYNWPVYHVAIIQSMIKPHIEEKIKRCFDNSDIERITGTDLIMGVPTADLRLLPESISLNISFPITLKGSSAVKHISFRKSYPYRLEALYNFILDELSSNIKDPSFMMDNYENYSSLNSFRQGFKVSKQENFAGKDDLYTFTDSKSLIEGDPLQFKVLIENRPPYLLSTSVDVPENMDSIDKDWLWNKIKSRAFDPDGNLLTDSSAITSIRENLNQVILQDTDYAEYNATVTFNYPG